MIFKGSNAILGLSTRKALALGCATIALAIPTAVQAQAAAEASDRAAASDEIVVTANKREENIADIGMSVSAFGSRALETRQIVSLEDVAGLVPGLTFALSGNNTPILTLRAVGFNDSSLGVYPAVSVYIDEAPLPFPAMSSHSAYDLQRVEVLKGPQGTLFGQNSTGGAINYIAAKPTESLTVGGRLSYGRFNEINGEAFISGPLTDTLRARVAVTGANGDGWQISSSRPGDTSGAQSFLAGRAIFEWQPSETLKFSLNANGWVDKSEPQAPQFIAYYPQSQVVSVPSVFASPFSPQSPRAADWNADATRPRGDRDFYQLAFRADIGITSDITLTSLSTYARMTQDMSIENDGTQFKQLDMTSNIGRLRSFSQELRIANNGSSTMRWVVGANYEESRTFEDQLIRFPDNGSFLLLGILASSARNSQNIRNMAAFGNIEYELSDRITLKAGTRYTDYRNRAETCGYDAGDGNINATWNFLGSLSGRSFTPLSNAVPINQRCFSLNASGVPSLVPFEGELKQDNVSWRVGVDFRPTDDMLVYANLSRGYKAGSFPILAAATTSQFAPVVQEAVTAYEVGFRSPLLDRALQLNAAAFYYDYKDKQVLSKVLDPVFGPLDALVNVPKSRVLGAEAELGFRPIDGLSLNANLTYLDTKITEYTGFNVLGNLVDAAGAPLPFASKWNYSLDGEYRTGALVRGGNAFFGGTVTGRSEADSAIDSDNVTIPSRPINKVLPGLVNPYKTNAFTTVDLRLGFEADQGWRVMLWGKNIFNQYYWTNVVQNGDTGVRYAARPATYGVTFGFKFD